jgi:hypothetical protein
MAIGIMLETHFGFGSPVRDSLMSRIMSLQTFMSYIVFILTNDRYSKRNALE